MPETQWPTQDELVRLAHRALEAYPFDVDRALLGGIFCNAIFYVCDTVDGVYALRFTPTTELSAREVEWEMQFLEFLKSAGDVIVPGPISRRDGSYVGEVASDHQTFVVSLLEWIHGDLIHEGKSPIYARALGELMAKLHRSSRSFRPPPTFSRQRFDRVWPRGGPEQWPGPTTTRVMAELSGVLPKIEAHVGPYLEAIYADEPSIYAHLDLHPDNTLRCGDELAAIDFQDAMWAHPIQDVGNALGQWLGEEELDRLEASFLEGYESVAPLGQVIGWLPVAHAHRQLDVLGFLMRTNTLGPDELQRWLPEVRQRLEALLSRMNEIS